MQASRNMVQEYSTIIDLPQLEIVCGEKFFLMLDEDFLIDIFAKFKIIFIPFLNVLIQDIFLYFY